MEAHKVFTQKHTISFLIHHKDKFKVDRTYQRELVWTRDMKQYFIDTILRKLDIGRIYVRVEREQGEIKYYIVDGQQRLNAIWEFVENKFPLSEKYSRDLGLGGKFYRELPWQIQESFDEYNVELVYLMNMSDEEVRDIYRRINSGRPLNTAEKLNALPGNIVVAARELSKHPFLQEVCGLKRKRRYRALHVASQILLLERRGFHDISPRSLFNFFATEADLSIASPTYQKVVRVFNYLRDAFRSYTPELRKTSWVITTYLLTAYLLNTYVMRGRESQLKDFIIDFYHEVQRSPQTGDKELIEFKMAISRGTTSKENIAKRHRIILTRFLERVRDLIPLDSQRDFTEEERVAIFRIYGGKCARCGVDLHDKPWHVHHKVPWSQGGKTTIDNGELLCSNCHAIIHAKNRKVI